MSVGAISTGRLRHRVTIQKNGQATRNAYGELEPASWSTVATVWAAVTPKRGTETTEADQVQERITHEVVTHYRDDVSAAMRLVWNGRVLEVVHVQDFSGMHRGMMLLCEETGSPPA